MMKRKVLANGWLLLGASLLFHVHPRAFGQSLPSIKTVFVIMMENHDWSTIRGSTNAPYINNTLLPMASHAESYYNPPGIHPSEPNYLWLEAGTNFGILDDRLPGLNQQSTTNHLTTLLDQAGVGWKTYQEDYVSGDSPMTNNAGYVARHNPFVFFTNVTANQEYCSEHVRPYDEFAGDLQSNRVARYNFLVPNLCDDMHNLCGNYTSRTRAGDDWLAREIPKILETQAYNDGGAVFIAWDEGANDTSDGPIGMIVLSPLAKGGGYSNTNYYTHSSTLRTLQEIFGVGPFLGDAASAQDLSDLFRQAPTIEQMRLAAKGIEFTLSSTVAGTTNLLEASADLQTWSPVTNFQGGHVTVPFALAAAGANQRFFRVISQ